MSDKDRIDALTECLTDMCYQFAYQHDDPCRIGTGGLSALEDAFDLLGWEDPHPTPEMQCDEPGCEKHAGCGWPSPNGYRRTCGQHMKIEREA
jgi:hypothetical protein